MATLFQDPKGNIGYISGMYPQGTLQDNILTGSGTLSLTKTGTTLNSLSDFAIGTGKSLNLDETLYTEIAGTFSGGGTLSGTSSKGYALSGFDKSVFVFASTGSGSSSRYTLPQTEQSTQWDGVIKQDIGKGDYVSLLNVTNGTWGSNGFSGTISGTGIDSNKLYSISGMVLGSPTSYSSFNFVTAGAAAGTDLTFYSSAFFDLEYMAYNGTSYNLAYGGELYGNMGGTGSLWSSSTYKIIGGSYFSTPDTNRSYVIMNHITSQNQKTGEHTTYDGGAYYGFFGGIVRPSTNKIDGRFLGLYISPSNDAGYLNGNLGGDLYPSLSMWTGQGTMSPTKMAGNVGIDPKNLYSSLVSGYTMDWKMNTGSISILEQDPCTRSIEGMNWGIYHSAIGGTYTSTLPTTWSGNVGGAITLGGSDGYWLANIANGSWSNGNITGALSGRFLTKSAYGTIEGDFPGTYNSDGTWQAIPMGIWQGTDLKYVSALSESLYQYVNTGGTLVKTKNGEIQALLGGTQTLWSGSNTPFTLMGSISGLNGAPITQNSFWTSQLYPTNYTTGKNVTYETEPGTYYGYIGGINRSSYKQADGIFYSLYIDPAGKAGILKGSYGADGSAENIYPEAAIMKADGIVNRVQINSNTGIIPSTLPVQWFNNTNYVTTLTGSIFSDSSDTRGIFLDTNLNIASMMTDRNDKLTLSYLTGDSTFGVWQMESWGSYDKTKTTERFFLQSQQNWIGSCTTPPCSTESFFNIQSTDTWKNDKAAGSATGFLGSWARGGTALMAGETLGVYSDSLSTLSASTTGTFIGTGKYLTMLDPSSADYQANKANLEILGFPTNLITSFSIFGSLPSIPGTTLNMNNMRIFSKSGNEWFYLLATTPREGTSYGVTGTYSNVPFSEIRNIVLTNADETIYGKFEFRKTGTSTLTGTDNWLAKIDGLGAFATSSGYLQGTFYGVGAGMYTSSGFGGSAAATYAPSTFLSRITTDENNTAWLHTYTGTDYDIDGHFKGLMAGNPIPLWKTTKSIESSFDMIGLYIPGSDTPVPPGSNDPVPTPVMKYSDHIFGVQIYPKNYVDSTKPYTTTDGGSYWGYLLGAHISGSYGQLAANGYSSLAQSVVSSNVLEGFISSLYVDPEGKTGILAGRFGGTEPVAPYETRGYFDTNNKQWWAYGTMYPVELGTTTVAPNDLINSIRYASYEYDPLYSTGSFKGTPGSISLAQGYSFDNLSYWISDAPDSGIWVSGLFGKYTSDTPSYPAPNGWTFDLTGANPESGRYAEATIQGGAWTNKRIDGNITGYWADIATTTRQAATGVMAGQVLGTFDPSNYTYQTVATGAWIETNKFLDMAATPEGRVKLQNLNIPTVEVGSATLIQSGGSATDPLYNVRIDNMKFFSSGSGGTPVIWAAGGTGQTAVSGNYNGNPLNQSVTLSGSGLSANFNMKAWDTVNSKWMSTIQGSGTLTGNTATYNNLTIKGAGAGTINQPVKSFTGTAAGIVK